MPFSLENWVGNVIGEKKHRIKKHPEDFIFVYFNYEVNINCFSSITVLLQIFET